MCLYSEKVFSSWCNIMFFCLFTQDGKTPLHLAAESYRTNECFWELSHHLVVDNVNPTLKNKVNISKDTVTTILNSEIKATMSNKAKPTRKKDMEE